MKIFNNTLHGRVNAIASKSIEHRHIICSFLANEEIKKPIVESDDVLASYNACVALRNNQTTINVKSSGSTLRFLMPYIATLNKQITILMNDDLSKRPIDEYEKIFGGSVKINKYDGYITVIGKLTSGQFTIDGSISSQYISGMLLCLPMLDGDSCVRLENMESNDYVNLTIDSMQKFGVDVETCDNIYKIKGNQKYKLPKDISIEADYSQSAFFIAAGLLYGDIRIIGLNQRSIQGDFRIIEYFKKMNGNLFFDNDTLVVNKSNLIGIEVNLKDNPDLAPILIAVASLSKGKSRIYGLRRLKYKESNRLSSMIYNLNKLKANIIYNDENEIIIEGVKQLSGNIELDSYNDHRIVMALSIISGMCIAPIMISGANNAVKKSYPRFFDDFVKLGGKIDGN